MDKLQLKVNALVELAPEERKHRSELVLDLLPDHTWGYYFVDMSDRAVYWVHTIKLADIIDPNPRIVVSNSHLGAHSFQPLSLRLN